VKTGSNGTFGIDIILGNNECGCATATLIVAGQTLTAECDVSQT
jgi:hypothetical protein